MNVKYIDQGSGWNLHHAIIGENPRFPLCGHSTSTKSVIVEMPPKDSEFCKSCAYCMEHEVVIECSGAGQARPYGPTINTYYLTDVRGDHSKIEVLSMFQDLLHKGRKLPSPGDNGYDSLLQHVMRFDVKSDGRWLYQYGHDYTG